MSVRCAFRAHDRGCAPVCADRMSNAAAQEPGQAGTTDVATAVVSATGGVAAALLTLVSAACCVSPIIAPIIVGALGASGAVWAAGLKPYGAWILGAALVFLVF